MKKPVGEWLLVEILEEKETKSGIILVQDPKMQNKVVSAKVLEIGPDAFTGDSPVKSSDQIFVGNTIYVTKNYLTPLSKDLYAVKPIGVIAVEQE
jgi:co-chaperonin GroES (HSP10)